MWQVLELLPAAAAASCTSSQHCWRPASSSYSDAGPGSPDPGSDGNRDWHDRNCSEWQAAARAILHGTSRLEDACLTRTGRPPAAPLGLWRGAAATLLVTGLALTSLSGGHLPTLLALFRPCRTVRRANEIFLSKRVRNKEMLVSGAF